MKNRLNIAVWVLGLMSIMSASCEKELVSPNIVFILADDLGYTQLGCYGSEYYQTPNLDQLAREGMQFTDAYAACAVCSPTRASIITGKYPARLHLTDFIAGNKRTNYPLTQPDWQKYLPLEEVTVAEYLKEQGYKTALFGKWHLSKHKTPPESLPFNPDKQGFDESFVTYKPSGGLSQPWQAAEADAHNVDTITSLALDFIDRNRSNPFILFVSHNTIHDPLKEKAGTIAKYEQLPGTKKPENHPVIAAMIERLDNSCGTILSRIKETGLEDNTIVVFFSDNGGKHAHALQTPLRAGKGWLYEGGIREPLLVKWNGHVEPGTRSDALVSSIDLLPTFLEMAGVDNLPESIDGKSIVPILDNPGLEVHTDLFWHYPHYHGGSGMLPGGAIRSGNWKLIEWYEKSLLGEEESAFELYDLENDIGETRDLSDSLKSKTAVLAGKLKKWREEVGAQMPTLLAQPIKTLVVKPTTLEDDSKANSDSIPEVIPITGEFDHIVVLRYKYKSDLLQGLKRSVKEQGINNGVIISGIGSVRNYHIHSVSNSEFPSQNIYLKNPDAPADLASMNGYIIDGRVHAHVTLTNEEGAFGGHLEEGTSIFTFAIVTIGVFKDGIDLSWVDDKTYR